MFYVGITSFLFSLRYALAKQSGIRKAIYPLVLFGLFLLVAFRFEVGCDWFGYSIQYNAVAEQGWRSFAVIREPIWWVTMGWVSASGMPYPMINIVTSTIFFFGVHALARRQPDPLAFLILLFPVLIINIPMSGIRQGAAIGLICLALVAFVDRRPIRVAFWVLLATGFHASALVFMVLAPIALGRYTKLHILFAFLLAIPGAYLLASTEVAELASNRYINSDTDAAGAAFRVGILGCTALYFFFYIRMKWQRAWPGDYALVSVGAIGMALAVLMVPISTVIGDRFGYYLIPLQAMIFARIPYLPLRVNKAFHAAIPYIGLIMMFMVWSQMSRHFGICYLPYQSWLFGFPVATVGIF